MLLVEVEYYEKLLIDHFSAFYPQYLVSIHKSIIHRAESIIKVNRLSTLHNLKRFQRVRAKRGSLEEKTKIFEENARKAKLSIDRGLLVQVLEEENRAHDEAVRELDEKLQEENRAHDDAIKELEEKIADLEKQIESSSEVESVPTETPSEPAQETTKPLQETPTDVDERVGIDPYQDARALLQESEPIESEVPPEVPKKKRRGLF